MFSFNRAAVTGVQKIVPLLKLFDSPAQNVAAWISVKDVGTGCCGNSSDTASQAALQDKASQ